jgi:hypothetical protein
VASRPAQSGDEATDPPNDRASRDRGDQPAHQAARRAPRRAPRALALPRSAWLGLGVVVVLIAVMALVSILAGNGTVSPQLGDKEAGPYNATDIAEQIAKDGPLLLPDASPNRSLDVYLQHLGTDPGAGWSAFLARAPGRDDRACTLTWSGDGFTDPCGGAGFPPDGTGLRPFKVRVTGNGVYVDLGAASTP